MFPAAADLPKWIEFQLNLEKQAYQDLFCPARLDKEKCNINDRFSIKCWSHTSSTFNEIPSEVKLWFLSCSNIDEPRVIHVPFGVHSEPDCLADLAAYKIDESLRQQKVYANWQMYTLERHKLWQMLKRIKCESITMERELPYKDYLQQLATHKFVLCPRGNGLDCFRTLETIYMGAVPIFDAKDVPKYLIRKNTAVVLEDLDDTLLSINKILEITQPQVNIENVYWSTWKNMIEKNATMVL